MIGIPVSEIMRKGVITARKDDTVEHIARILKKARIGRVIVTERDLVKAEPALLELMKEKGNLEHILPSEKEVLLSGNCEECRNYSENLRLVEGKYLCEDCR